MPTGYTAEFADRDLSFEEFVWKCVRSMGAFIHMRDDSLSAEIRMPEPDSYHRERMQEAVKKLSDAKKLTVKEAKRLMAAERERDIQYAKEGIEKHRVLRDRYTRMLAQIAAWNPPTPEHANFKKFMTDQLTGSLDWDCNDKYYLEKLNTDPGTPEEWIERQIKSAQHDIEYHTQHMLDDDKRHQEVTNWISALQNSVPLPK